MACSILKLNSYEIESGLQITDCHALLFVDYSNRFTCGIKDLDFFNYMIG